MAAANTKRQCYAISDPTRTRIRQAKIALELERSERVSNDRLLRSMASAMIAASLMRVRRAGGDPVDRLATVKELASRPAHNAKPRTTQGPAPSSSAVYEH